MHACMRILHTRHDNFDNKYERVKIRQGEQDALLSGFVELLKSSICDVDRKIFCKEHFDLA